MSMMKMKFNFFFFFFFFLLWPSFFFSKNFFLSGKVSLIMVLMVGLVSFLCDLSKSFFLKKKNFSFSFLMIMMALVCVCFFLSSNMFLFFLFFEMTVIPIFVMISGWGYQLERINAGYYLLLYTSFFSLPFIIVFISISFNISVFFFSQMKLIELSFFYSILSISLFLVKSPIYFFHLWLPKAHVESPVMGSIILAGVLLKLGIFGFLKMFFLVGVKMAKMGVLVSVVGCVVSMFVCFFQVDQKSLIAYASVGHMTITLTIICSMFLYSVKSAVLLMLIHALVSSILFFSSFLFFTESGTRLVLLNQGALVKSSLFLFFFLGFVLINFSVPPFPSFFSELVIMASLIKYSSLMGGFIMMIVFLGCLYSIYLLVNSIHGKQIVEWKSELLPSMLFSFWPVMVFCFFAIFSLNSLF